MESLEISSNVSEIICRICLTNEEYMESIFSQKHKFVSKIYELTNIEIFEFRDLPKHICSSCTFNLLSAYNFRDRCISTNHILMKSYPDTLYEEQVDIYNKSSSIDDGLEVNANEQIINIESKIDSETNSDLDISITTNVKEVEVFDVENDIKDVTREMNGNVQFKRKLKTIKNIVKTKPTQNIIQNTTKRRSTLVKLEIEYDHDTKSTNHFDFNDPNFSDNDKELETYPIKVTNTIADFDFKDPILKDPDNDIELETNATRKKICEICGKMYSKLQAHMITHTGEKRFKCPYCKRGFSQKFKLNIHINIHTGNKPYKCTLCPLAFCDPNSLKCHNVKHTGERKYKCDICDKSYSVSYHLSAHKRIHFPFKKHICSFCERPFLNSNGLKKHIRIHTGEKPYKCEFCKKSFNAAWNLTIHRRVHTKERLKLG